MICAVPQRLISQLEERASSTEVGGGVGATEGRDDGQIKEAVAARAAQQVVVVMQVGVGVGVGVVAGVEVGMGVGVGVGVGLVWVWVWE